MTARTFPINPLATPPTSDIYLGWWKYYTDIQNFPTNQIFDVTKYGAVGDDSTDNKTAIVEAIAAAVDAGGGIIYFPDGNFLFSGNAEVGPSYGIILYSNIWVQCSAGAVLKPYLDDQQRLFVTAGIKDYADAGAGPGPAWPPDPALRTNNIRLINVNMDRGSEDTALIAIGNADNVIITGCQTTGVPSIGLAIDVYGACSNLKILHNTVYNQALTWLRCRGLSTTAEDLKDVIIDGNHCTTTATGSNDSEPIAIQGYNGRTYNVICKNNIVNLIGADLTGIKVTGYQTGWGDGSAGSQECYNINISDNIIIGSGGACSGIPVSLKGSGPTARLDSIFIKGNIIQCEDEGGIVVDNVVDCYVIGNLCSGGGALGGVSRSPVYIGSGSSRVITAFNISKNWDNGNREIANLGANSLSVWNSVDDLTTALPKISGTPNVLGGGINFLANTLAGGAATSSDTVPLQIGSLSVLQNAAAKAITTSKGFYFIYASPTQFAIVAYSVGTLIAIALGTNTTITGSTPNNTNVFVDSDTLKIESLGSSGNIDVTITRLGAQ